MYLIHLHYDLSQTQNLARLFKHITERNTEGTRRRGRKRKQLLHGVEVMRRYWNLEYGAVWRTRFGKAMELS